MTYFRHIQVFYEVLVVLFFIYSLWIAVISLIFLTNPQVFVNPSVPSVHLWMCSELGPEVAQGYPCGLTALSVPQNPAAGMSLGSVSGKKRGEWTTRRQDYGWCVDFYFTLSAFGFGGFELWSGFFLCGSLVALHRTVFGTTAAPWTLFHKYLQCRVCCHHSCFRQNVFSELINHVSISTLWNQKWCFS